jgi:hypothetical protein
MSECICVIHVCGVQMAFLVPTSLVMHNFWELEHGSPAHQIEFINFMKVRRERGVRVAWCSAI